MGCVKKTGLVTLIISTILLQSCGNKIGEGHYLLKNYRFADSTFERLVSEAVESMDVSDSVLLVMANVSYDWTFRIATVGIGTYHPEYHHGVDNRAYMNDMEGVIMVDGNKCLLRRWIANDYFEEVNGISPVAINDSLDDDIEVIQIEKEYYFFLDTLGCVVRDSAAYNYTSSMFFDDVYYFVENDPQFPGGLDSLQAFVERNLRNPRQVEGKMYIEFVVERDGRLTDIKVLRGIDEETDEEALRVIRMMPRWEPARQRDVPVRFLCHCPVCFKPTKK